MDLTEFLLARIAEDEEAARAGADKPGYSHYGNSAAEETLEMALNEGCSPRGAQHFSRWMPDRVLVECRAKRNIVQGYLDTDKLIRGINNPDLRQAARYARIGLETAMITIAQVYADHPDFQEEWKL